MEAYHMEKLDLPQIPVTQLVNKLLPQIGELSFADRAQLVAACKQADIEEERRSIDSFPRAESVNGKERGRIVIGPT
jgi:hypothetical protein